MLAASYVDAMATEVVMEASLVLQISKAVLQLTRLLCLPQVFHIAWKLDEEYMSPDVGTLWRLIGSHVPYRPESATDMLHRIIYAPVRSTRKSVLDGARCIKQCTSVLVCCFADYI